MAEQSDSTEVVITRTSDVEKSPQGIVRRWVAEIELAKQAREQWLKEGKEIQDTYDTEKQKANSFNILWSNTETLRPAVYSSTPEPDVRRRFRDADPVGKIASTVLERALSYQIDDYDFDGEIQDVVLDVLLPGRGVARIKYEPHFAQVTAEGMKPAKPAGSYSEPPSAAIGEQFAAEPSQEGSGSPVAAPYEKLIGQDAQCEHVQWDDYLHGPGKRWKDIPWDAFRHEFTMEMAEDKFGPDIAKKLKYEQGKGTKDITKDKQTKEIFKVCEVWEIWDKEQRRVLFIAPTHKAEPCLMQDDPLRLRGFRPLPKPIRAIEKSWSSTPTPLYRQYKQQALELDRMSARINKIVNHLKVRGAYSAHLPEAAGILDLDDGEMLAIANPSIIAEHGGLDKMLWTMPVDKIAAVLKYLYDSREQTKQTIYEISGVADILRGSTNPNETLGAQRLKSQWGSLRIQKIQKEVQRFIRDLLRLKAEIISEHFTAEQLAMMTNIELPDQQAKMQAQAAIQQGQVTGQQPPPQALEVLNKPTWEDVIALLRSDRMRQYRIDIETDSTVADTVSQDMQGLAEVTQQVAQILGAVAQGLPMEVAKNIALAVVRRARMGSAVEDALEALQQPPPQQTEQAPPDHSLEVAQIQAQNKQAIAQIQEQTKVQIAQMQSQAETQRSQLAEQIKTGREQQKAELDAAVKVIVAQITATKAVEAATARNAAREFSQGVVS